MNTIRLKGSDDITRQVGRDAGIEEAIVNFMVDVAEGNVGAMHYLVKLYRMTDPEDGIAMPCLASCLRMNNLTGSRLYSMIKTAGGPEKAYEKFSEANWI